MPRVKTAKKAPKRSPAPSRAAKKPKAAASKKARTTAKPANTKRAAAKRAAAKPTAAKPTAAKRVTPKRMGPRADFGAPVDSFFARQPPELRAILDTLRKLVSEAAPQATSSLKWGMPFYALEGNMLCAIGGHKSHVNLILPGPPGTYADPEGLLEGGGTTGKHLKLRSLADLPKSTVKAWLKTATARAKRGE